jgi:hypothetical protein
MRVHFSKLRQLYGRPASLAFTAFLVLATSFFGTAAADVPPLPKAEEVLRRISERAEQTASQAPAYEYTRTKSLKILDGDRKPEHAEEEVFRMAPQNGKLEARLLTKDGKAVSAEEAEKIVAEDNKLRPKGGGRKPGKDDSMSRFLDSETARRFTYETVGEEVIARRPAYVLTFQPRTDLPARSIEEKVMARVAGRVWVDQEEAEVVRIDSKLTKSLSFALGIIGVLHDVRFSVERRRLENGQWANSGVRFYVHFRQLFATRYIDYEEKVSDFVLIPAIAVGPAFGSHSEAR